MAIKIHRKPCNGNTTKGKKTQRQVIQGHTLSNFHFHLRKLFVPFGKNLFANIFRSICNNFCSRTFLFHLQIFFLLMFPRQQNNNNPSFSTFERSSRSKRFSSQNPKGYLGDLGDLNLSHRKELDCFYSVPLILAYIFI